MQNPDLALWRTVLVAGVKDAARGVDLDWLASDDFAEVCNLAQVEPDAVLMAFNTFRGVALR